MGAVFFNNFSSANTIQILQEIRVKERRNNSRIWIAFNFIHLLTHRITRSLERTSSCFTGVLFGGNRCLMAQRRSKRTCRSLNFKFLGNIRSIFFKGFTFFHYRSSFINPTFINSSVCIQCFNIHHRIFTTINTSIFTHTHVIAMSKAIHHVIGYC